jgi:hypothetical protein
MPRRAPARLGEYVEFSWLYVSYPRFRAAPDKRKAYFEHCMVKSFRMWLC